MKSSASTSLLETQVLPPCPCDSNWCRADLARMSQIVVAPPRAVSRRLDEVARKRMDQKGLAWIASGHILRTGPPLMMNEVELLRGLQISDEAIGEVSRELRCE